MSYIALALFAEGPADHRFLEPLIRRAVEDLVATHGTRIVEVGPVRPLPRVELGGASRHERIQAAVEEDQAQFHVLFVHTDANGDADRARAERVAPSVSAIESAYAGRRVVGVIPSRTSEAWALRDGDALREVLSTTLTDAQLGLPTNPETVQDAKRALDDVVARARPGRRGRRRDSGVTYLELLGETASLEALRDLGSFREFEESLKEALIDLGYIPRV